jgi:hypothetical protein
MPLPTIPGIVRCAVRLSAPSVPDEVINVVHVNNVGTISIAALDAIFQPAWQSAFDGLINTHFGWQDVTYTTLDGSAGVPIAWHESQPTNATAQQAMNAAIVMSWRTTTAGRSFRGRSYLGPIGGGALEPNEPDKIQLSSLAGITAQGDQLIADLDTGNIPLVVASYTLSSATPVDHAKCNPLVGTVRKRSNGR